MTPKQLAEGRRLHEEAKNAPFKYKLFARFVVVHAEALLAAAEENAALRATIKEQQSVIDDQQCRISELESQV